MQSKFSMNEIPHEKCMVLTCEKNDTQETRNPYTLTAVHPRVLVDCKHFIIYFDQHVI